MGLTRYSTNAYGQASYQYWSQPVPKKVECMTCGNRYDERRRQLGYNFCLDCGEFKAIQERETWCRVPLPKQGYTLVTRKSDLLHLNQKTR